MKPEGLAKSSASKTDGEAMGRGKKAHEGEQHQHAQDGVDGSTSLSSGATRRLMTRSCAKPGSCRCKTGRLDSKSARQNCPAQ